MKNLTNEEILEKYSYETGDYSIGFNDRYNKLLDLARSAERSKYEKRIEEIERRHQIIMSEPNGIVRETMISTLFSGIEK